MRKSPYAGLALHHRMPKAPRHTPPRQDWRRYAETARKPRSTASLGDMMRQCNRDAWDKTYRAQVTSECWEDECQEFTFMDLPRKTRFVRHAVATLLLLPLALITAMSLCDQLAHASGSLNILFSIPVWYALMGAAVWVVLGSSRLFTSSLLYLYVLGHELTHVLAVFCSRGSIHAFKADLDGGYIQTDKNNLFISLSPYFLPLWAMLWGLVWGMAHGPLPGPSLLRPGLLVVLPPVLDGMDHPQGPAGPGGQRNLLLPNPCLLCQPASLPGAAAPVQRRKPAPLFDGLRPQCGKAVGRPQGPPHAGGRLVPVKNILFLTGKDERQKVKRNPTFQQKGDSMQATHFITLTMAAVSLMGCNPKETVNALTSDQNVTQQMAVRFAENMVGLPRALVVSDARKAAPGDKVTVKGAVLGDEPVFSKNIASFTIGDPAQLLANMKERGVWSTGTVPVEIRKNNTMTVQFVDDQGQPIKHSAKGVNGLKERDAVIITGTIDPHSTPENPVLNIESIVIE